MRQRAPEDNTPDGTLMPAIAGAPRPPLPFQPVPRTHVRWPAPRRSAAPVSSLSGDTQPATLTFQRGWTLISMPNSESAPGNASAFLDTLLHGTGGSLAALYGLTAGQWSPSVSVGGQSSTGADFPLAAGGSYLLYSDTGGDLTLPATLAATPLTWSLASGWNLVGLPQGATAPRSAGAVLHSVADATNSSVVALFRLVNGGWAPAVIVHDATTSGTDFVLVPGQGYLLYMSGTGARVVLPSDAPLSTLASSEEGIHLGLVCDYRIDPAQRKQLLVGKIDYLWCPYKDLPVDPSIYTSAYKGMDWDTFQFGDNTRGVAWWKANHPDWLVYKCDRTTLATPAPQPDNPADVDYYVPLDISNPAVRDWQMQTEIAPAIVNGNNSIGFDNVLTINYTGKCGVWRNGSWVQLYSGQAVDPAYEAVVIDWARDMSARLHALSMDVAMNMNLVYNPTAFQQLASAVDVVLDEGGFTNWGQPGNNYVTDAAWTAHLDVLTSIVASGKALYLIAYEPETQGNITRQEVQWALANYLLIKSDHTFTFIYPSLDGAPEVGLYEDRPEYHAPIGHPTDAPHQSQGVWMRDYSNGLAIVNPASAASFTVDLPVSTYQDLYGQPVNVVTLAPHSGIILLTLAGAAAARP